MIHASPVYDSGGIFLSLPPGGSVIVSNITVSNVESLNITALQLQTFISGTLNGNFSITLISPSGTPAVLLSESLVPISNIFNGTIWSDQSVNIVGSQIFVNGFTAPVLRPKGSLNALVGGGQEVNGNWSLQIQLAQSGVVLERWILNLNRK